MNKKFGFVVASHPPPFIVTDVLYLPFGLLLGQIYFGSLPNVIYELLVTSPLNSEGFLFSFNYIVSMYFSCIIGQKGYL